MTWPLYILKPTEQKHYLYPILWLWIWMTQICSCTVHMARSCFSWPLFWPSKINSKKNDPTIFKGAIRKTNHSSWHRDTSCCKQNLYVFLYFQVIFMGREEEKYWFCCKINFPSTSKLRLVFHVFITCLMHSSSTFLAWGMSIMSSPNMWKYVWDEKRQTPAGRQRRQ